MPATSLPLEGIRVIDVAEHGFVPTAAAVLAEYGADVIKVERPEGAPNRKIIPSGMVATRVARYPKAIDLACGFQSRNPSGTRSTACVCST